eukprot:CAMPEP_0177562140 /NCGR_PEP_ID=MMETSP0369-20130122/72330_1 /TAXON_ID=447022 ORGANISM="Scrippsiella hangoei-like, Strain SHHI-4" /NCGR_SAMPLE_ID=MMETSP0369 /ASSEMBLY_ACC=CAM_ASM_000364 /LENGTH=106 /DNA_ID=CAMNT_0019049155 /DNA_START=391 /DNA_END=708 /DNA_ORIENTATION=+
MACTKASTMGTRHRAGTNNNHESWGPRSVKSTLQPSMASASSSASAIGQLAADARASVRSAAGDADENQPTRDIRGERAAYIAQVRERYQHQAQVREQQQRVFCHT